MKWNRLLFKNVKKLFAGRRAQNSEMMDSVASADRYCFNEGETTRVLKGLKNDRKLKELPLVYWILLNGDGPSKYLALEFLKALFNSISLSQYAWLDAHCRERTSLDWYYNWPKVDPKGLAPPECSVSDKITTLGFASFHPNGYFREKAVIQLAGIGNPDIVPFLLIRLNDWVENVRLVSKRSIKNLIKKEYAKEFIKCLPLVFRLSACGRDNHTDIISAVTALISGSKEALLEGIKSKDPAIRRMCYKIGLSTDKFADAEIFGLIGNDGSGHVRSYALRCGQDRINETNCKELLTPFLDDKNNKTRCQALDLYCKYYLKDATDILLHQALSVYASVRETSIYFLKKVGMENIPDIYKKALSQNNNASKLGPILGLGETGQPEDALLLLPFLSDEKSSIVRAALRSISKLKMKDMLKTFIPFLTDNRPGVSRETAKILKAHRAELQSEDIAMCLNLSNPFHVRKNTFQILVSLNAWDSLLSILRVFSSNDAQLHEMAEEALNRWFLRMCRTFVRPTDSQLKNVKAIMDSITIEQKYREEILFRLK